jgi:hypothetical protein
MKTQDEILDLTNDEMDWMASISDKKTGIQDVVIWIGPNFHKVMNLYQFI